MLNVDTDLRITDCLTFKTMQAHVGYPEFCWGRAVWNPVDFAENPISNAGGVPPPAPLAAPATVRQSPASSVRVPRSKPSGATAVRPPKRRGGGISGTWRGPARPMPRSGVCSAKGAAAAPGRPSLAPGYPPARRLGLAARQEQRGGRAGRAARRAADKATAEAVDRARAHCRGARFGGRGSVQSSLFDGISVYRVYTLISTCFLLLLLLLRDLLLLLLLFLLRNFAPAVRSATAQPGKDAGRRRAAGGGSPVRFPRLPAEPRARRAMARRPRHSGHGSSCRARKLQRAWVWAPLQHPRPGLAGRGAAPRHGRVPEKKGGDLGGRWLPKPRPGPGRAGQGCCPLSGFTFALGT
ncbi:hypothetical protein J1605_017584 [Eschrichtius robustus]|uniref:Uncharacterized protein n=1 Tax=Eschrichtius robustus TaxID=9764 RepID=A0AB34I0B6_ESCRO|nr:hypothetical protein J1605_017584 [Eschrichtius robustus]